MDDHQFSSDDFICTGVLASVCTKNVLQWLYLVSIGGPNEPWTDNMLARSRSGTLPVTKYWYD